jgi:hypothetical protein
MLQGISSGVMGTEFSIEVAEDSDANRVAHGSIVLEGMSQFGSA